MNLVLAIDSFLLRCRLMGLTDATKKGYSDFLNAFCRFTGNIDLCHLNMDLVNSYILFLQDKGVSAATVATHIRHLKAFINWLGNEDYIEPFSRKIKAPKIPRRIVYIYNDDEIKLIFSSIKIAPEWLRLRNCLMIALMLDSGLRQNEVCLISLKDLHLKEGFLRVHGKGNKDRIVPLGGFTMEYLSRYMKGCPYQLTDSLLVNRRGQPISKNALKLLISKLSKELPFEISCHRLRHNFATHYCLDQYEKSGMVDIYSLMVLLGHEDTKTTRIYLHLAQQVIASKSRVSHLDKIFS